VKLIDTHAHLDFAEFDSNREAVIARATKEGVGIVNCSLNREGWDKVKGLDLYHSIGSTPYHLEDFVPQYKLIDENADKIVAVGEIGLDYHWIKEKEKREQEVDNFLKLLKLAKEIDKPVLIHSRNAEKPALDILEKERVEKAIMHCFSGSMEEALRAIDLGYLISIPTNLVRSKQKQEFATKLPLDSIILETDAPYLSPEPDTVNEPVNVVQSARKIAELREIPLEEVEKTTTKTAKEFFRI